MNPLRAIARAYFGRDADRYPRPLRVVLVVSAFNAMGWSAVIPYLPIYLNDTFGVSFTEVGLIIIATAATRFAGGPLGGVLADRWGRRPTLMTVALVRAAVFVATAWLIIAHAPLWAIIAILFVRALVDATFMPALQAIVADLAPAARAVSAFGLVRVGQNVGWAAGPIVSTHVLLIVEANGGDLATAFGCMFISIAVVMVLACLVVWRFIPETHPELRARAEETAAPPVEVAAPPGKPADDAEPGKSTAPPVPVAPAIPFAKREGLFTVLKDWPFVLFSLATFPVFLLLSQMVMTLAVFANVNVGIPESSKGWLYTLNGLLVVLLQVPWSRMLEKLKPTHTLLPAIAAYTIGFALIGLAPMVRDSLGGDWVYGLAFICLCLVLITVAEITHSPTTAAIVARIAPPHLRGRYMGVFGMIIAMGFTMGPAFGGPALDIFRDDPVTMWVVLASLGVVAAITMVLLRPSLDRLLASRTNDSVEKAGATTAKPAPAALELAASSAGFESVDADDSSGTRGV